MKFIGITQSEELKDGLNHDYIDSRWIDFFYKCDLTPILIPNNIKALKNMIKIINFDGFLLTGGGLIKSLGGKERRDQIEIFLIEFSLKNNKPIIGVCRGMQQIQNYFDVQIYEIKNHVMPQQQIFINGEIVEKNSYHNFGSKYNNDREFDVWARSNDKIIKAINHKKYKITAIMWHPERLFPFHDDDIIFFKKSYS